MTSKRPEEIFTRDWNSTRIRNDCSDGQSKNHAHNDGMVQIAIRADKPDRLKGRRENYCSTKRKQSIRLTFRSQPDVGLYFAFWRVFGRENLNHFDQFGIQFLFEQIILCAELQHQLQRLKRSPVPYHLRSHGFHDDCGSARVNHEDVRQTMI
jgi:hypothetical protein